MAEQSKQLSPEDVKVNSNDYNEKSIKFEDKIEPKAPRKGDKKILDTSNETIKQKTVKDKS